MSAERLLQHYERVAEAPNAVARLRRFILDLAVRGKLVPQDLKDEPALELLKRIAAEKMRAAKAGAFREPNSFVRIERKDLAFTVPNHWQWARLIEIAKPSYGFAFPSGQFNSGKRGVPLIRIRDISSTDTEAYFEGGYDPRYLVKAGDYLVGMDGDFNLRQWRGKDGLLNQRVMRINGWRFGVAPEYVRLPLQFILDHLHGETSLTTVKHLSAKQVNGIEIPLPPLAEQHRIVAKVNELMTLCDRLEAAQSEREVVRNCLAAASLTRLNAPDPETFQADARFALAALPALTTCPDQIKQLRRTILSLAVRGKLVPQDPKDEPAAELLKRISSEKAQLAKGRRGGDAMKIIPMDGDVVPFAVAPAWVWVSFGDIVICRDGERVPVSKEERNNRSKKFDYYGASGVIDKINEYLFDKPLLLIGEDGANLINRSSPIAFIARGKYWVNNHAHVLDGLSEGLLKYLEIFINAIDLRPYVTGTAQPKMNQAKMNSIPVPLPPLAEQHRIVAKVDGLMALCDRLEVSLAAAATTRRRLLDALIAEALAPVEDHEMAAAE